MIIKEREIAIEEVFIEGPDEVRLRLIANRTDDTPGIRKLFPRNSSPVDISNELLGITEVIETAHIANGDEEYRKRILRLYLDVAENVPGLETPQTD